MTKSFQPSLASSSKASIGNLNHMLELQALGLLSPYNRTTISHFRF